MKFVACGHLDMWHFRANILVGEPAQRNHPVDILGEPAKYADAAKRLIDRPEHDENPNLDFVLLDTVGVIEQLRREGRTVLVHCVGAYSRTPTVAALYRARLCNVSTDDALRDVMTALPGAHPNSAFGAALRRIGSHPSGAGSTELDRKDGPDAQQ